jgi:hypothetical protein
MNSVDQSHLFLGLNVISTLFHFSLKVVELLLFDNVVTTCISCFLLAAMNLQLLSLGHLNYKKVKDERADPRILIFLRVHSFAWLQDICRYAADTLL